MASRLRERLAASTLVIGLGFFAGCVEQLSKEDRERIAVEHEYTKKYVDAGIGGGRQCLAKSPFDNRNTKYNNHEPAKLDYDSEQGILTVTPIDPESPTDEDGERVILSFTVEELALNALDQYKASIIPADERTANFLALQGCSVSTQQ